MDEYNKALERAREIYSDPKEALSKNVNLTNEGSIAAIRVALLDLFPEEQLKETDSERIRKWLYNLIDRMSFEEDNEPFRKSVLAWLEKLKEPATNGKGLYNYDGERFTYLCYSAAEENSYDFAMSQQEKQKEQKESRHKNESVLRIKGLSDGEYLFYNYIYSFCAGEGVLMSNTKGDLRNYVKQYYPELKEVIIKEQKAEWSEDIIRKAIKEVGLTQRQIDWLKNNVFPPKLKKQEWNEKERQLLHIAENAVYHLALARVCGYTKKDYEKISSFFRTLCPQPKQEWSEEDEKMIERLIRHTQKEYDELCKDCFGHQEIISDLKESCRERMNWLEKRLKSLRPQPKAEWNEEDERMRKAVLDEIEHQIEIMPDADDMDSDDQDRYNELISMSVWMQDLPKCMKPHWKPSEEQMKILQYVCEESSHPNQDVIPTLQSLYEQLKKL